LIQENDDDGFGNKNKINGIEIVKGGSIIEVQYVWERGEASRWVAAVRGSMQ
jgi:hypothetical protein